MNYLEFLPDIYQSQPDSPPDPFLESFLKIFEAVLSGTAPNPLPDSMGLGTLLNPEIIGDLFYPRFSFLFDPANSEFLPTLFPQTTPYRHGQPLPQPIQSFFQILGVAGYDSAQTTAYLQNEAQHGIQPPGQSSDPLDLTSFTDWLDAFLNFLASWIDLHLPPPALVSESSNPIDVKRALIATAMPQQRVRGTLGALSAVLQTTLATPLATLWPDPQAFQKQHLGNLMIWTPAQTVQIFSGLTSYSMANTIFGNLLNPPHVPVAPFKLGQVTVQYEFHPDPPYDEAAHLHIGQPLLGGHRPNLIEINVYLPSYANPEVTTTGEKAYDIALVMLIIDLIKGIMDTHCPETSQYQLNLIPTIQVGVIATLGVDTLLGRIPTYASYFTVGDAYLGANTGLPPAGASLPPA